MAAGGQLGNEAESAPSPIVARIALHEQIFDTARVGIRTLGWVAIAWFVYLSVKELAGKDTWANIVLAIFAPNADRPNSVLIWQVLALVVFLWAIAERKFRLYKVGRLSGRIRSLEEHIDPNRSSSGLTTTGETHPKDKLP